MMVADFPLHFLRPWWCLAVLPLPLALWLLAHRGDGRAALARIADPALLANLLRDTGARRRLAPILLGVVWTLAVAALAGPAWQRVATPLYVNGAARVVVLSLSNDMLAADLKPDRMTRARFAVRDLLKDAGDARTALVAFAGAAFTVAPLTSDKNTVVNLLQALQPDVMPVAGDDAAAGIAQAVALLQSAHVAGGQVVLVTDTAGAAAVAAASKARAQGVRIDVLGIGTRAGAPVPRAGGGFEQGAGGMTMAQRDDAALRAVASAGEGSYAVLQADGSGAAAFAAPVARGAQASHARGELWRDGGVWLLPVLVVCAALAFRRGWLLVLTLLVLPPVIQPAHAAGVSSWFANRDQRAAQALRDGEAARARKIASSTAMQGAADYRAGRYADAARAFAQGDDARAHYNLGNALARQGDYANAIAQWREALHRDPELADARANVQAVEDWLKQRQRQQPSASADPRTRPPASSPSSSQPRAAPSPSSSAGSPQAQTAGANTQPGASSPRASATASSGTQRAEPANAPRHAGGGSKSEAPATAAASAPSSSDQARAQQGVARALQGAHAAAASASPRAFALGRQPAQDGDKLDGQQRAMLQAVPDDPGALLRRKFRLEWEQRQGRLPQGDSP